jgi:transposase-like protein
VHIHGPAVLAYPLGERVDPQERVQAGVNGNGQREVLGVDVVSSEGGAGWLAFLRDLVARGLTGVRLVTSDAHSGLVDALAATLPGAGWQRCRTHYARNLSTQVPKSAQPWVLTLLRTIFDQPDSGEVRAQFDRVVDALHAKFPKAAEHLADAGDDLLAFTAFPREIWKNIWSNNPQERLNKEVRRRTDVVGIFPNRAAIIRLVGAVLMEQTDEWAEQHRYMGLEVLAKVRHPHPEDTPEEEVLSAAITA